MGLFIMRPHENFDRIIWYVLRKIKTNCTQNKPNIPVKYGIDLMQSNDELEILDKLVEWSAIHIFQKQIQKPLQVVVILIPVYPQFNEIYEKFESWNHFASQYSQENKDIQTSNNNEQLLFPKSFLRQEVERFHLVLKYFVNAGAISVKDYQFLKMTSKMMKTLIGKSSHGKEKLNRTISFPESKIGDRTSKHLKKENSHQPTLFSKPQPIPIVGEIVVPGLNERLDALKPKSPEYSGPKFPYKIPAGTHWNNVIIKFLDDESVEIYVRKLKHITNYKEMGMVGKGKIPGPSEQWNFLKVLAQLHGELTINDQESKEKYKKHKLALGETLRNYFSIDYDPFYPYKSSPEKSCNSYKIKLLLIPPSRETTNVIAIKNDSDTLGIQEFLDEAAPQILDY